MPEGIDIENYADDILNYIIGHNVPSDLPQKIVDAVFQWCNENKMRLKIGKCKTMVISKWQTVAVPAIINQTPLKRLINIST